MSRTKKLDAEGNPVERKPRKDSEYWLMVEVDDVSYQRAAAMVFGDPASAWKYAADNHVQGKLFVLCNRGTRTGKKETQEVYTLA